MSMTVQNKIDLFSHNQTAYEAAVSLLSETGKAAIIHPTGTGKSFIGFKLAEDNPDSVVCWLSPSEYIFKTQIENLIATGADAPANVVFFTYAKLMLMSEDEIAEINPDVIIIDEFHRVGAEYWGKGVQNLLNAYPNVPILGLSATNIRYLDNQRDMADELFDGNVASEMTLGEAIVRGILMPPKYVLSVFSYQKDLEKYEKRIRSKKNKAVRDAAKVYLDALRRALDKADGLDEIFDKHLTDRTGKYIVFCANYDHMQEMIGKAGEWFVKVDRNPRIYTVYSADPSASKSFDDFKKDSDTTHLRLLFCIDALNEGIHLYDISGVILLRPTVSPIIFKQQIGRALTASKSNRKSSVIIDVINNIANLYSIGEIEEEMQIATTYYRYLGNGEAIVNEHFKVIDEVRDCLALFEKLNDTLSAPWSVMYEHAKDYYLEYGNLEIPARYMTEDGYSIGRWIFNQRNIRKGLQEGKLTEDKIAKLDAIGMRWDIYTDVSWNRNFPAAQKYYDQHGNLDMPAKYVTEDGVAVGSWLSSLRTWERAGAHPKYLTDERKKQLEAIGMIWDKLDYYWEKNYLSACEYYREHRNLDVQSNYVTKDGVCLGSWLSRLRKLREGGKVRGLPPTEEQIARLDNIGMIWGQRIDHIWEKAYAAASLYFEMNGNLLVPVLYTTENGIKLGSWVQRQRRTYKNATLSDERKERLEKIGMVWDTEPWMTRYNLVKAYYEEHGTVDISQTIVIDGVWLGKWIVTQKKRLERGELSDEQSRLLKALPIEQVAIENKQWLRAYEEATDYYKEHGNLNIPTEYLTPRGLKLADWIVRQRRRRNLGEMPEDQIQKLNEIGFIWKLETAWEEGYRHAREYYAANGNLDMSSNFRCNDGYALGRWVFDYRKAHNGLKSQITVSDEQTKALEEIGMDWSPLRRITNKKLNAPENIGIVCKTDQIWNEKFETARQYYHAHKSLPLKMSQIKHETQAITYWLNNQRKAYREWRLTQEQLQKLGTIGITEKWLAPQPTAFDKGYEVAKSYYVKNGNLNITSNYQHENGFWLGAWVDKIRKKKSELTEEQIEKLNAIHFVWDPDDNWENRYSIAERYFRKHGSLPLEPKQCQSQEDRRICEWLRRQLLRRNAGKMPQEQIDRLSAIGMDWLNSIERAWNKGYTRAKQYYKANGNLNIPVGYICGDGYPLGEWLHSQRTHRKRLDFERVNMLTQIGATGFSETGRAT